MAATRRHVRLMWHVALCSGLAVLSCGWVDFEEILQNVLHSKWKEKIHSII